LRGAETFDGENLGPGKRGYCETEKPSRVRRRGFSRPEHKLIKNSLYLRTPKKGERCGRGKFLNGSREHEKNAVGDPPLERGKIFK